MMKMIIFSGLPGTGKSTLAESFAGQQGIPVFAKDWLEAVLSQNGLQATSSDRSLGYVGYELLTVLAERQLMLGQSVILDSVAAMLSIRKAWMELSEKYQAKRFIIECVCSDESLHRSRLTVRKRHIPGWHELEWSEIERVKQYYQPWNEDRLILDMAKPLAENLSRIMSYCE